MFGETLVDRFDVLEKFYNLFVNKFELGDVNLPAKADFDLSNSVLIGVFVAYVRKNLILQQTKDINKSYSVLIIVLGKVDA